MKTTDPTRCDISVPDTDEALVRDVASSCGVRPLTARILVARGHTDPDDIACFLSPSLERDWRPPTDVPGLDDVADAVGDAIASGRRILVFGDFDADGITATAISVLGLGALGATVKGLIPHRWEEGYALSERAVARGVADFHPDLVMTVDCGIACAEEVARMRADGLDVVITDHHEPSGDVPAGVPVADPKLVADCPARDLCGAGVALKLVSLLGSRMGMPDLWREFTDLAALGTIGDIMELSCENRSLVADGLARIASSPRPGVKALLDVCKVSSDEVDSTKMSFSVIPRINAAGRMGDATVALDLLLADDPARAAELAAELDRINTDRRSTEAELEGQVRSVLDDDPAIASSPVVVVAGEGWHEGVKGIVASRIARSMQRPAIVFCIDSDGIARGSGRSWGGVNLYELVQSASDLYDRFGGHAGAVGITVAADRLGEVRERLSEEMRRIASGAAGEAALSVDAVCTLDECDVDGFAEIERLGPFGQGNRLPLLCARGVFLEQRAAVGKQGKHVRFVAADGVSRVDGIFFNPPDIDAVLDLETAADVVFEPSVDEWRGRSTAKLVVRDVIAGGVGEVPAEGQTETQALVGELLEHHDEICDTSEYAGIERQASFHTKVVGVSFENRQEVVSALEAGVELCLVREPGNEVDPSAIAVHVATFDAVSADSSSAALLRRRVEPGAQLGYLKREIAARLAPLIDEGVVFDAAVTDVTGGPSAGGLSSGGPFADTPDAGTPVAGAASPSASSERRPGPLGVRDAGMPGRSWGVNIIVRRCDLESCDDAQPVDGAQHAGGVQAPNAPQVPGTTQASDAPRSPGAAQAPEAPQALDTPAASADAAGRLRSRDARGGWDSVAASDLDDELRRALIGDKPLHDAQSQTLANLAGGLSTLSVMATGRGKSLIFHLHAARTAILTRKASIFVYPLRALAADQLFHLEQTFSGFGLEVRKLTGESSPDERDEVFGGLAGGSTDVIVTTPEFLCIHADKFAQSGRVGFVVVDEAHHIGQSKAGNRPAYAELEGALEVLGKPLVLAVTATAGDEEARLICECLGIEHVICDPTVRDNLRIDDRRDSRDRDLSVAGILSSGEKSIVYVNSRDQSMTLTRNLRRRLPALAPRIAFYNAGLVKGDRRRIESAFRAGELTAIVSTSAFGEGIDIPDVRHVVLYHMPFSAIEFNQMSGRVGRDGAESFVHVLFSWGDARINEAILASGAPPREALVALWRVLAEVSARADAEGATVDGEWGGGWFAVPNAALAERANKMLAAGVRIDEGGVSTGIAVFRELGLVETAGRGVGRHIRLANSEGKVDLMQSARYREGIDLADDFADFKQWVLSADASELLARFNRPILPTVG